MQSSGPTSRPFAPKDGCGPEARLRVEAEADLARRIQGGDRQAFETFYDRFAPGVFSMIYAVLDDQKESEDVLQEAFAQMWKRAATYDPGRSSLFTWAVMISRHQAIERLRSRQRRSDLTEAVGGETGDSMPLGAAGSQSERERVCAAMEKLEDGQREAIDLAFFTGLTQTQIAEKLGAPLGTVKARIRGGLMALRQELKGVAR